jgi:oligoendopeptidase F
MAVDITKNDLKFTVEKAQQIVLDVLAVFGKEYLGVVKKAFNEKWIS